MPNSQLLSDKSSSSFDYQDWEKGYRSQPQEFDYWIDQIEGEIPPELQGTLFRNGPGLLDVKGQRIHHPFDGDGLICRIAFTQGKAHFRNRFVRTEGFLAEQAAGKILYRGVFGTQKPGGWLANAFDFKLKHIANTNVLYWGRKLLALWEAAAPYRLDPRTLDTLGQDYFDGVLQRGTAFSAHPRIDPNCVWDQGAPHLVNFSTRPGRSTTITIYELDQSGTIVQQHDHAVPGFAFMHDFAITPNYCIFFQNPMRFNPLPFALGLRAAGECMTFQADRPTRMLLIPRHAGAGASMRILETKAGFVFHHANAFEQGHQVVVDSICYASFPALEPQADYRQTDFTALPEGQLWRFTLDPTRGTVQQELLESRCCEFPTIHPDRVGRPYRYVFTGAAHQPQGNAPLQAILKLDLETGVRQVWSMAPRGFAGEPLFVPRPHSTAEDDGWVFSLMYNAAHNRSELVILDGRDLELGPIARLRLKHHIPYGLHGSFTPQYFGPDVNVTEN
ncbi:Apocarotenoid-15,15'-oxygenase [Leptolyngbya sp. 'hensonii']|uniref:carotenoid oxygenase family protein n=1 Tax=Leptolyngbya sp. 'hensonii' TaxID=1922337 RepID=UPI000950125F|nr:carotenoid oxygenase family protein [Leptolyngbya sp. 'hensonii']OLP20252.1 Apocarotenoid-15,15'-oxygenase [Leptolyngbya sp. 'hensonii']